VLVAIQLGIELGFAPMQAMQSIAVVNGRPSVWGDGFLALLMASPFYQDHDEYYEVDGQRKDGLTTEDLKKDPTTAVCTFWRHGKSMPVTRRFSVGQAKKAGLLTKAGTWTEYPDRMLAMRARGFAGRDTFPDVLRGLKTTEELRDMPELEAAESTPPRLVQRLSETRPSVEPSPQTPPAEVIVTGQVHEIEESTDCYWVTLRNGERLAIEKTQKDADVAELLKFGGTDHLLRFVCKPTAGNGLALVGFTIAD